MSITGNELIKFIIGNDLGNKKLSIQDENQENVNIEEDMIKPEGGSYFFGSDWIKFLLPSNNKIVDFTYHNNDTVPVKYEFFHNRVEYVVVKKEEYEKLDYDKATNIGLWATDKTPEDIMRLFLGNFESDVNPFCTESKEEKRFLDQWDRFVKKYFWKIK